MVLGTVKPVHQAGLLNDSPRTVRDPGVGLALGRMRSQLSSMQPVYRAMSAKLENNGPLPIPKVGFGEKQLKCIRIQAGLGRANPPDKQRNERTC